MSTKAESKRDETENQVGELDPSGFIRITGKATGQIELGEGGPSRQRTFTQAQSASTSNAP